MKSKKPSETRPITPMIRAANGKGSLRLKRATATDHRLSINTHSSSEPSCPPQTAATR